jgi:hypothetical protein
MNFLGLFGFGRAFLSQKDMMKFSSSEVQILNQFKISIFLKDLDAFIGIADNRGKIFELAEKLLSKVQGIWRPRAIIRWLTVERVTDNGVILTSFDSRTGGYLQLGAASIFMINAKQCVVGVYSAGDELEKVTAKASLEKEYMDAFLYDLIGLVVLEKTRLQIEKVVEEEVQKNNWGVGPFLSPGSVHGWELADQANLCALIPLDRINIELKGNVFRPFKTISCLIGTGPKYVARTVGSTCDVCLKSQDCNMRRLQAKPINYE